MKTKCRKRLLYWNDDRVIANPNDIKNRQYYYIKVVDDLDGLNICETVIENNPIIPRIGETITIPADFMIKCMCYRDNEFEDELRKEKKWREIDKCWGEDVLDYFFPQKTGELKKDYKHRLYNFILKHGRRNYSSLKETSGDHIMANCILDIINDLEYKVINVNYCLNPCIEFTEKTIPRKSYVETNIYLLGKKKGDFKWE